MKYISLEELQKHIIRDECDDGCGYIDERDISSMPTVELKKTRKDITYRHDSRLNELKTMINDNHKELQKLIKKIGYKGCKNCKHQIAPLRMCRWAEQGGDGQVHFVCPKWGKAESEG